MKHHHFCAICGNEFDCEEFACGAPGYIGPSICSNCEEEHRIRDKQFTKEQYYALMTEIKEGE